MGDNPDFEEYCFLQNKLNSIKVLAERRIYAYTRFLNQQSEYEKTKFSLKREENIKLLFWAAKLFGIIIVILVLIFSIFYISSRNKEYRNLDIENINDDNTEQKQLRTPMQRCIESVVLASKGRDVSAAHKKAVEMCQNLVEYNVLLKHIRNQQ